MGNRAQHLSVGPPGTGNKFSQCGLDSNDSGRVEWRAVVNEEIHI